MKALIYFVLGFTLVFSLTLKAYGQEGCPKGYTQLPNFQSVCVPSYNNIQLLDRRVMACVAYGSLKVRTEWAAQGLPQLCAAMVMSGKDWRKALGGVR